MVTLRVGIDLSGPLLTKNNIPGLQRLRDQIVTELINKGDKRLADLHRPKPAGVFLTLAETSRKKYSKGNFAKSVNPDFSGASPIIATNSIYGPWLEGDSARNATTRFKGYQTFRKTGQWLQKEAGPVTTKPVNAFIRSIS